MRDLRWSASEKKVARAAFDKAYARECEVIRRQIQSMLEGSTDLQVIWRIESYLAKRRREIDAKYDYRYSVLIEVFARLLAEGWLEEEDLAGLSPEKRRFVKGLMSILAPNRGSVQTSGEQNGELGGDSPSHRFRR